MIKKSSSQVVAYCGSFLENGSVIFSDHNVNLFQAKYNFITSAINETSGIISVLSTIGNFLVIPVMALSWIILIDQPSTYFLRLFKWSFFPIAAYYASRVYFLKAYLSNIHSESKKLVVAPPRLTRSDVFSICSFLVL